MLSLSESVSGRGRQAIPRALAWSGFFTRGVPSVDKSAEVSTHTHIPPLSSLVCHFWDQDAVLGSVQCFEEPPSHWGG